MSDFRLDAEKCKMDLGYDYEGSSEVVAWAQRELEEHLNGLKRVYGESEWLGKERMDGWRDWQLPQDTHTALLWGIEGLKEGDDGKASKSL